MKVVVCEKVTAVVKHLREDDGERHYHGGLDTSKMLCYKRGETALNGWDTHIPVPPAYFDKNKAGWCKICLGRYYAG